MQNASDFEQVDNSLMDSEGFLRTILDMLPGNMAVLDQNGRIVMVNQSWINFGKANGLEKGVEWIGQNYLEECRNAVGCWREGADEAYAGIAAVLSKDLATFELEYPCSSPDEERWFKMHVSSFALNGQNWALILHQDISKQKVVELDLKKSEADLRAVTEQSPIPIQIHGLDGKLLQSNTAYAKLFALNDEALMELYEKYDVRTDAQAKRLGLDSYVEQVYSGQDVEFPVYEYDGIDTLKTLDFKKPVSRKCWVRTLGFPLRDASGNIVSAVFMSEDITERMQVETALHEARIYTDNLIDTANVIIIGLNRTGGIEVFNPEAERITGYSKRELEGKNWFEVLVPKEVYPQVRQEFERLLAGGLTSFFENPILTKDGEERIISWSNNEIRVEGEILGTISFGVDITSRKQAEQDLQAYQQRLKAMAAELTLAEEQERRRIAADLHDHVSQSLALARIQVGTARKTASDSRRNALLDEVSQTLLEAIRDTRTLIFDLSSPLLNELGLETAVSAWLRDQVGLQHELRTEFIDDGLEKPLTEDMRAILFRNVRELLANVVRHAQANGVEVSLRREGANIEITVRDDGVGFDLQTAALQQNPMGGFGLFSIQERMADLGGSLVIESKPGQGCMVRLTAPLELSA